MSERTFYEQIGVAMTCRSYAEYVDMFALDESCLKEGLVLDVAAGASSFAAEADARGIRTVAADPLYALDPEAIYVKGLQEIASSTEKLAHLREHFDWTYYGSIEHHRMIREASLKTFAADYERVGRARYVPARLPELPFPDESFRWVLCSHFLFLYGEQFDVDFHIQAVRELLRVCRKGGAVLVFPLKTLGFQAYPHMSELLGRLSDLGVEHRFLPSRLPFMPGPAELLSITKGSER